MEIISAKRVDIRFEQDNNHNIVCNKCKKTFHRGIVVYDYNDGYCIGFYKI